MKGVIIAGGVGSRLFPITKVINKNLLPIYDKPTILYPINAFVKAGVTDICIVAEENHIKGLKSVLDEYSDGEVNLSYIIDTHEKKGPAQALYYAKDFAGEDNVIVAFADNNFDFDLTSSVLTFKSGAKIFVKEVSNPSSFGVVEFDSDLNVIGIEEKPEKPKSKFAVTGLSIYDKFVFDYIENLKPAPDGEYYLMDINLKYLSEGLLKTETLNGFWSDTGTFEGLARSTSYWFNKSSST